jgi:penicillin amidase
LAGEDWTAGDQLTIQTDVHDTFLAGLSRQVVAAYESRGIQGSNLDEIIGLLKEWDGQMEADEVAPLVALLTFQHLRRAVAEKAASNAGVAYDFPMSTAVIEGLLRDRPEGWFENWDQLVLRSLVDAIEEGKRSLGEDTGKWSYGRHNRLELSGGVLTRLPLIGSYFRLDPVSLNGSQNTIQQVQLPLGPSMRMALDAGNWDASLASLTLGQSGQRFSAHFDDQWESYREGRALPLQYQQVIGQSRLQIVPAR